MEINNNIQESYCSIEIGKILKEKGFFKDGTNSFNMNNTYSDGFWSMAVTEKQTLEFIKNRYFEQDRFILKPTHAVAIEWLRVNFGIWVYVLPHSTLFRPYAEELIDLDRFGKWEGHKYNSPQEATEEALKYVLDNLIK
jgi:hypothetical protein